MFTWFSPYEDILRPKILEDLEFIIDKVPDDSLINLVYTMVLCRDRGNLNSGIDIVRHLIE
jgi:hypothetical protein